MHRVSNRKYGDRYWGREDHRDENTPLLKRSLRLNSLIFHQINPSIRPLSTNAVTPISPGGVDYGFYVHLEGASFVETDHTLREKLGGNSELALGRGFEEAEAACVSHLSCL